MTGEAVKLIVPTLLSPLVFAIILALVGGRKGASAVNTIGSSATFILSAILALDVRYEGMLMTPGEWFFVDEFSVYLVVLTAFVSMTTSIFSGSYMEFERRHGHLSARHLRFYHAMYQLFMFAMLLALMSNNIGVLWIAMELATLSTVLLVSLYRTRASLEAAWKYFILCGVGIALAMFGTVLMYFAGESVFGEGSKAMLWTNLTATGRGLEPTILSLAFIFFMVGYGTKVGLVPLHNWLPDAHAEGPTPVSAVLSGLLLNIALYALVRTKVIVDGATGGRWAGDVMIAFGLLSLIVAAFSLFKQRDIKRLFAYSSIEHMGIATFAFGLGGPLATYGALLHMIVHSLTKSSIFFSAGYATQVYGTQSMDRIRGLIKGNGIAGFGLVFGVMSIVGLPPFGVFASEFLILTAVMREAPYLAPFFLVGIAVAFAALITKMQPMVFGEPGDFNPAFRTPVVPIIMHMAIVLLLGLYIPSFLSEWFEAAVRLII